MGRLIDTDDLIQYLGFENTEEEREENVGEIITLELIDNIPTAYDLDDVLKKLEKEIQLAEREKERTVKENLCQFDTAKGYANGVANTYEIVKCGGRWL